MSNEIIIGIGGLVLATLTYFAGVYRTEKRLEKDKAEERIAEVVKDYMHLRSTHKSSGLDGLQKAGVATLADDSEVRTAAKQIMSYGENDPLQRKAFLLDDIDLKEFFVEAAKTRLGFFRNGDVAALIEKLKGA